MQLVERPQNDGSTVYYIEHVIEPPYPETEHREATPGHYLMIECTTKQQAITILKQLHAANDIYTEMR